MKTTGSRAMTSLLFCTSLLFLSGCGPLSSGERYQTVQTQIKWIQVVLDTRTGRVWQISNAQGEGTVKIPINEKELGSPLFSPNGRFKLRASPNMWNYLLTDQKTGKLWRCQFAIDEPEYRYIESITSVEDL